MQICRQDSKGTPVRLMGLGLREGGRKGWKGSRARDCLGLSPEEKPPKVSFSSLSATNMARCHGITEEEGLAEAKRNLIQTVRNEISGGCRVIPLSCSQSVQNGSQPNGGHKLDTVPFYTQVLL